MELIEVVTQGTTVIFVVEHYKRMWCVRAAKSDLQLRFDRQIVPSQVFQFVVNQVSAQFPDCLISVN